MANPAPTIATSRHPETARLKIEPSTEGFWQGRDYRVSEEFSFSSTDVFYRFECTKNFILRKQTLEVDSGAVRFRVYRASQGTEGGTFSETIPIYKVNFMVGTPNVETATTITTGGTFTPDSLPAGKAVEFVRIKSAGLTAIQSTITGGVADERGLPPGVYYLALDQFSGGGLSEGSIALQWEEVELPS